MFLPIDSVCFEIDIFLYSEAGTIEAVWKQALPFEKKKFTDSAAYVEIKALRTIYEDSACDWQNTFTQFAL